MDSTDLLFQSLVCATEQHKWCEWQLVQWWQWNVHLTPLAIWRLPTNHHWVVAWLLLDANCPVLLTRGGIPRKGLTAQWLQQFASSTEVGKYPFVQWCHEAMNQSFNPNTWHGTNFQTHRFKAEYMCTYVHTYVCLYPASVVYVRAYSMPQYKISLLQNDRTTK